MNDEQRVTRQASQKAPRITLYDHSYETFAIQYLAAILQDQGFDSAVYYDLSMDMDYLDQDFFLTRFFSLSPRQLALALLENRPEVVGFSIITPFYRKIRAIISELKRERPDILIIAGGPHVTLAPEKTLDNKEIDFIFVGEADSSLPDFLRDLACHSLEEIRNFSAERMPGVWNYTPQGIISRGYGPFQKDLDAIPFPLKDPYYAMNPSLRLLYTATCSRGCVFSCTYCNSNTIRKRYLSRGDKYFRMRSVDNVMTELREAKRRYNPRYIMFLDNLFAPQINWLKEFAPRYRDEIGLPFFCETNPMSHTKETLNLLAEAGCALLQFGFQSANEEVRKTILGRRETNQRIRELVLHAKSLGMFVCVDHIANLPGEVRAHLDEAVELYQEIRPNWINLGFLQYYPEADIIEIAISRKLIRHQDLQEIYSGEGQTSFRLLSRSSLNDFYRTLPIRLFAAFKLPVSFGKRIIAMIDHPKVAGWLSGVASPFIYLSRILNTFTDKRDFLVRHHIIRNLYVMVKIIREKRRLHA